tara:strand:- start:65 stop:718 length:654 start_codon:yes stop_codon:yes gene_type:complete
MTLNISTPFAYYIGHGDLPDFDFTEIRKEKRITWAESQTQAKAFAKESETIGLEKFHDKYYRILESYTELRDLITYNFNLFLDHTFGCANAKISTSWITYMTEGERNKQHRHANCFYSGVIYIDEEYGEDSATLELRNPISMLHETIIPAYYQREEGTNKTIDNIYVKPKTGSFVFFPSYILHGTDKHVGPPRKSLAFNFVLDTPVFAYDSTFNPKW